MQGFLKKYQAKMATASFFDKIAAHMMKNHYDMGPRPGDRCRAKWLSLKSSCRKYGGEVNPQGPPPPFYKEIQSIIEGSTERDSNIFEVSESGLPNSPVAFYSTASSSTSSLSDEDRQLEVYRRQIIKKKKLRESPKEKLFKLIAKSVESTQEYREMKVKKWKRETARKSADKRRKEKQRVEFLSKLTDAFSNLIRAVRPHEVLQ